LVLDDSNSRIIFFGLGRNVSNPKPELYGEVVICGITEEELERRWKNAKDKVESEHLILEDIDNSAIRTLLKEKKWSPVGRTATIATLRNRSIC
jgi:predicted nucleic acid-binding protein